MLKVVCVLKSGGDYNITYLERLFNSFQRHLSFNCEFICLSDIPCVGFTPLIKNWSSWWSKIEIFRIKGNVMFIDLDTVILRNIDRWADAAIELGKREFMMIKAFNPTRDYASALMAWNGDFSWIYREFNFERKIHKLEQQYIVSKLKEREINILTVNDALPGIYSYKRHCRNKGMPPKDASIILFHGKPRPHECREKWIKDNWI